MFYGSQNEEDPPGFIDEVFKFLSFMGVSQQVKEKSAANQSKGMAKTLYDHWMGERLVGVRPID